MLTASKPAAFNAVTPSKAWLLSAGEALRLEAASLNNDDEGVAVLLAQLDAITRHALALSDLAERVTGHLSYAYAIGDNVH